MALYRIHLAAEDLKRFGLVEPPTFDSSVLMQLEAEALQEAIPGFDPDRWGDFLAANGVHVNRAIVWCTLRRAGLHIPLAELDFDRNSSGYERIEPSEPEGKDETSTPDSSPEPSDEATSPSSPTSTESAPSTS